MRRRKLNKIKVTTNHKCEEENMTGLHNQFVLKRSLLSEKRLDAKDYTKSIFQAHIEGLCGQCHLEPCSLFVCGALFVSNRQKIKASRGGHVKMC